MHIEKEVIERVERSLNQYNADHNTEETQFIVPNQNYVYEMPTMYKDTNVKFSNYSK